MLGIGVGLTDQVGRSGTEAFDPASLFGNSEKGFIFDFTDPATLFQNSNGTTAVAADADPIGFVRDLSPNGANASQSTNARRPAFNNSGNRASFNTSRLSTAAINLTAGDKFTLIISLRNTGSAIAIVAESSSNLNTISNVGAMQVSVTAAGALTFGARGSGDIGSRATAGITRPYERVVTHRIDIAQTALSDEITPRVDGAAPSLTNSFGPLGGGNLGNFAFNFGARANDTVPMTGALYRVIGINRVLTADELVAAEAWVGEPIGFFP